MKDDNKMSKMGIAPIDRASTSFYYCSIVTITSLFAPFVRSATRYWSKIAVLTYPTSLWHPRWG